MITKQSSFSKIATEAAISMVADFLNSTEATISMAFEALGESLTPPHVAVVDMGIGAVIGLFSPLIFALVLYILGFGCIGITAGTCASAVMSCIHPVASGSVYAYFQSCGMGFPWGCCAFFTPTVLGMVSNSLRSLETPADKKFGHRGDTNIL